MGIPLTTSARASATWMTAIATAWASGCRHFLLGRPSPRRPMGTALAVLPNGRGRIRARTDHTRRPATWVGNSTFLVQLGGVTILTDPIWSDRAKPGRASPGRVRLVPPGLAFADLPPIHAGPSSPTTTTTTIDAPTVDRLRPRAPAVVLRPAGASREWFRERGITHVVEMGLVGQRRLPGAQRWSARRAQHSSGRTLTRAQ
jgi:L-ascorbate metabolism protein UlaG (beta-lactamase superfamily)